MPNAFAAPFTMVKQLGEQGNLRIQSIQNRATQTLSRGLDILSGGAAAPSGITPQSLLPGNLIKTISQAEEVMIPAGLPKLAQAIMKAQQPAPPEQPTPTSMKQAAPETTGGTVLATTEKATAGTGYRKVIRRGGI